MGFCLDNAKRIGLKREFKNQLLFVENLFESKGLAFLPEKADEQLILNAEHNVVLN